MTTQADTVAVIAIHGVGDPRPGDTACDVAALLVAQAGYVHTGSDDVLVLVRPVDPGSVASPPTGLGSSYTSSFTEQRLGRDAPAPGEMAARGGTPEKGDLHAELARELIAGTMLADHEKVYTARRVQLQGAGRRVDVWDLYWGDISGLAGAIGRIVAELYTLIFHLCQLGRDTVHHMAIDARRLGRPNGLARSALSLGHQWADALLTKPSGVINALLVLVALWWLALAAIDAHAATAWTALGLGGSAALALCGLLAWSYRPQAWGRCALALLGVGAFVLSVGIVLAGPAWAMVVWVALLWLATLSAVFMAFMAYCEPRVRGVRWWGAGMLVLVWAVMSGGLFRSPALEARAQSPMHWLAQATGGAIEVLTVALLMVWAAMALCVLGVVLAGTWLKLADHDPVVARSIDTGRIGMYASIALFVTLSIAAWTFAIDYVIDSFGDAPYGLLVNDPNSTVGTVADLVAQRYQASALTFSVVLLVLLGLLGWLVAVLAPSVAAELAHPQRRDGTRLGRWLSGGGAALTRGASRIIWLSAVFFIVWAAFALDPTGCQATGAADGSYLCRFMSWVGGASQEWLGWLVALVAGSAAGLIVIGSRVFGALGTLRLPLDAALDVDKHFREFPQHATPRGRIAARTLSLLEEAAARGCSRIVLVAHSQGTIIVGELLRYLQTTDPARLASLPPIYLFTCGNPLRQLYESRFPALYPWAREEHGAGITGPRAQALGVRRWTNAYCTGDYVGRWVWHIPTAAKQTPDKLLSTGKNFDDGIHRQLCLGKGAHTHYYDASMAAVATEIDELITTPL